MSDVIDEVVKAEEDARGLVEAARKEASATRSSADAEVARIVSAAREEAAVLLRQAVAKAREEATAATTGAVATAESAGAAYLDAHREALGELVEAIVGYICTPEYGRDG